MEESWRMRMGVHPQKLSNYPHRRSTGNTFSHHRTNLPGEGDLNPEDFDDVFGGPPRTVISRQFGSAIPRSRSSSSTGFSYEDVFLQPVKSAPEIEGIGGKLPHFGISLGKQRSFNLITNRRDGYYGDVLGWENKTKNTDDEVLVRSRSRSKASSSSVLSSEDLSPLRPAMSDDGYDDVYLYGSNLRWINIPSRSNIDKNKVKKRPLMESNNIQNISEIDFFEYAEDKPIRSSRRDASAEKKNVSLEPILSSSRGFRKSSNELKCNSPASRVVSLSFPWRTEGERMKTIDIDDSDESGDDGNDEILSSCMIEFDIEKGKWSCDESNGVEEAIAWAKEKSQTHSCSSHHEDSTQASIPC